jgi:high-affinity iron transporter
MLNTFVIVWRESLEALLVIGVLAAWAARQPGAAALRRQIGLGVAAGVALAGLLGAGALLARTELQGQALDFTRLGVVALAATLMLHMVVWMQRHGPTLRGALEADAARAGRWGGVAAVTGLAVAREGAETVVFLSGIGMGADGAGLLAGMAAGLAGLLAAAACAGLLMRGARGLATRRLMQASRWLLLLVGSALVMAAADQAIALELVGPGLDPVWDTSGWLDDNQGAGRVLADFAGYRARPCATSLAAWVTWWLLAAWLPSRAQRKAAKPVPAPA